MHHIALCTPCIALLQLWPSFAYAVDHMEPKTEIQVEQVQWVIGGTQASSREVANIVVIKTSPGASNHHP
jgi:hypothetical protein